MADEPRFELTVDRGRSWSTVSEFGEYDATHFVAGALLAGAQHVEIERVEDGAG